MKNNKDSERAEGRLMGREEVGDARENGSGICGPGEGL